MTLKTLQQTSIHPTQIAPSVCTVLLRLSFTPHESSRPFSSTVRMPLPVARQRRIVDDLRLAKCLYSIRMPRSVLRLASSADLRSLSAAGMFWTPEAYASITDAAGAADTEMLQTTQLSQALDATTTPR